MKFIKAANFTAAKRKPEDIWYLVIHDEEAPQKPNEAVAIAEYFHNQPKNNQGTSAHRVVDNTEIVRCVKWTDIAWAAPGANTNGVHWEQSGYVRQNKETWEDAYGNAQLHLLAEDVAKFCWTLSIPAVLLLPEQLRENETKGRGIHRGICGHDTVTKAFPDLGTHTDPGPNFPWKDFMKMVQRYRKQLP